MKVGEHNVEARSGCPCEIPVALIITHERPGLLSKTLASLMETASSLPLVIFDDGSSSPEKLAELDTVGKNDAKVIKLPHQGFAKTWMDALRWARNIRWCDSIILLEDDIQFAHGWLDVLQRMQRGITERGFRQGMTSCFRPHDEPQSEVVDLCGVKAYQSMAHTFHVNMIPKDALDNFAIVEESVKEVLASKRGLGLDVYLVGNLAHRAERVSFVSTESWVAHVGLKSIVAGQGFGPCRHCGFNLVPELEKYAEVWKCQSQAQ